MDTLIHLEQQGWEALAAPGDAGKAFYSALLTDDAVMVFPGGLLVDGKEHILQSIGPQPWTSFHLDRLRVLPLSDEAAIVVYQVTAQRAGSTPYTALVSSAYAQRDGQWKLMLHQQTPV